MSDFVPSKAANRAGVCCTPTEAKLSYTKLDEELKKKAIVELSNTIADDDKVLFKALLAEHGENDWFWHIYDKQEEEMKKKYGKLAMPLSPHMQIGMAIRNHLRKKGFGEKEFNFHNLDCIYIELLTEAIK